MCTAQVGFLLVCLCFVFPQTQAKNLLINPGFEEVKEGKLVGWSTGGISENGKGTIEPSDDKPRSGKRSAHIKGDAEWATFVSSPIPATKGKTYELKGYLRVGQGQAYLKFDYFKKDMHLGMTMTEAIDSKDWIEQTLTSELTNYPDATHFTATLVGANGQFEAWFDDISVLEKP